MTASYLASQATLACASLFSVMTVSEKIGLYSHPRGPKVGIRQAVDLVATGAFAAFLAYVCYQRTPNLLPSFDFTSMLSGAASGISSTVASAASYVKSFFVTPEPEVEVWEDTPLNRPTQVLKELQDLVFFIPHYLDHLFTGGQGQAAFREKIEGPLKDLFIEKGLNGSSNLLETTILTLESIALTILASGKVIPKNLSDKLRGLKNLIGKVFIVTGDTTGIIGTTGRIAPRYLGPLGKELLEKLTGPSNPLQVFLESVRAGELKDLDTLSDEKSVELLNQILPNVVMVKNFAESPDALLEDAFIIVDQQGRVATLDYDPALRYLAIAAARRADTPYQLKPLKNYLDEIRAGESPFEVDRGSLEANLNSLLCRARELVPKSTVDFSKAEDYARELKRRAGVEEPEGEETALVQIIR